jgi:hypothetical protein
MEEKIESKMTEVVKYIIGKPKETITADDYMILASELKDARFRREQAEQGDRMGKLLAAVFPPAADVKNLVPGKTNTLARVAKK